MKKNLLTLLVALMIIPMAFVLTACGGGTPPEEDQNLPSAPRNLMVTNIGDRTITITWNAPLDDGGYPISSYQVSTNGSIWTPASGQYTHTWTNLQNNVPFVLHVRALNENGAGASAHSIPITSIGPAFAPLVPFISDINVTTTGIEVSWFHYALGIGEELGDGRRYELSLDNWATRVTVEGDNISETLSRTFNVDTTVNHTLRLRAVNSMGFRQEVVRQIDRNVPRAPTITNMSTTANSVTFGWSAPAGNGTTVPVATRYEITVNDNMLTWNNVTTITSLSSLTHTISGLLTGMPQHIRIRAVNSIGAGEHTEIRLTPGAPTAVQNLSATTSGDRRSVTFTWNPPANIFGSAVFMRSFELNIRYFGFTDNERTNFIDFDNTQRWTDQFNFNPTNNTFTRTNVDGSAFEVGTVLTFTVWTLNNAGQSIPATIVHTIT